ncbi:MAG: hydroxyacid dehydrogenase [Terrimicrobiaceae bacterium]
MPCRALVICPPHLEGHVFPPAVLGEISRSVERPWPVLDPAKWKEAGAALRGADVIVSTWGMPALSPEFLEAAPNLKAVFYAAGSVKGFVTDAGWKREIIVSSAWAANGVPVAEYSFATILLSLKRFWHFSRLTREGVAGPADLPIPGCYHSKVGLVSLGAVGRATARMLQPLDVMLLAHDPFFPEEQADELQVSLVSLEELFRECDAISIHAPWVPETERMITGALIASMKQGATLINTSRGAVIAEDEMIGVLRGRPDLSAVLDVSFPEPPAADSPLRSLPNVVLTPHIAGSMQAECARLGSWMADELRRFVDAAPLRHRVTQAMLAKMA